MKKFAERFPVFTICEKLPSLLTVGTIAVANPKPQLVTDAMHFAMINFDLPFDFLKGLSLDLNSGPLNTGLLSVTASGSTTTVPRNMLNHMIRMDNHFWKTNSINLSICFEKPKLEAKNYLQIRRNSRPSTVFYIYKNTLFRHFVQTNFQLLTYSPYLVMILTPLSLAQDYNNCYNYISRILLSRIKTQWYLSFSGE